MHHTVCSGDRDLTKGQQSLTKIVKSSLFLFLLGKKMFEFDTSVKSEKKRIWKSK